MFLHLLPKHYFKKDRHFYICSFGGCGSWMIAQYLSNFGTVHHVHSRKPPARVTAVEDEHFTSKPPLSSSNIVIYVYRDPVAALLSVQRRFPLRDHFEHIQCSDPTVTLDDIAKAELDLIGLTEFFYNYTRPDPARKYRICCVKYELFFDRISEFNKVLSLIDYPKLYPRKREHPMADEFVPVGLTKAYQGLRSAMTETPFLFIS